jgi:squalene-hopene/tetraprenyl-beta-curcumene cyclase
MGDLSSLDQTISRLSDRLRDRRVAAGHWEGHLSSSALSTGTAVLALHLAGQAGGCRPTLSGSAESLSGSAESTDGERLNNAVQAGRQWLVAHQNADGGWGDTVRSRSNISTTAIVWGALSKLGDSGPASEASISRAADWLRARAGDVTPDVLRSAILKRYGKDRTRFLTVLCGKLGGIRRASGARSRRRFELAALPHGWFQHLQLPVALGAAQVDYDQRRARAASWNPGACASHRGDRADTPRALREMQPGSGGPRSDPAPNSWQ